MSNKANNIDEQTMLIKLEMDQLVEKIKELDIAIAELNELFKMRSELLKDLYEQKKYELEQKKDKQQSYLRELFEQVPQNETKTQRKVKLLSGDVVVKKSNLALLIERIKELQEQYLTVKSRVISMKR